MFFPRSNFNQSFCGVVLAVVVVFAADVVLDVVVVVDVAAAVVVVVVVDVAAAAAVLAVVVDVSAFRKSFEFVLFHHHL